MIRKGTIKDVKTVLDIEKINKDPVGKKAGATQQYFKKHFEASLKNKKLELYLYDNKGCIFFKKEFAGFNNCEIDWLSVHKDFQKQGIGKKLVAFVEQKAKKLGFRGIYLYSHKDRKAAHKFYNKIGYKKINEFPNYYSSGDTSYLFGKILK